MTTTAVIVARGGSVRLPGKAMLPFGGSTLVAHKVRTLRAAPGVDRVVVGSDSPDILAAGVAAGAEPLERDAYHCDESRCSANEMIADVAGRIDGDVLLWAHPTNPLVRPETYAAALAAYRDRPDGYDSLASVTAVRRHAWARGEPWNFAPGSARHPLAAELDPVMFQDGAIFIQSREQAAANRYFYGRRPVLFPIDPWEGVDVDTRADYDVAVALYNARRCSPP